ncbi:MAG: HU family DNA-binding protein [Candidatus Coatesbacteria bacterium]|nr:MAG: HU family DNA-binding protein [Candidatus Coatesbacteria bacterium]
MSVSKSDIAEAVAQKAGLPKSKAENVVGLVFDTIQGKLQMGERVSIVSFGTFEVRTSKGRMGRNPKTGETIYIPEKKSVKFKAGKGLKEAVR